MEKVRVGVLCSGGGTNFQAIYNAQEAGLIPHGEVKLVVCDHADAFVLERARRVGVPAVVIDRAAVPDRAERERRIVAALDGHSIGLVVFAGFMTILSGEFAEKYEGRAVNVHPALLPSFGGKGMYGLHVHEAVLRAGVKVTGATVHYVTAECDAGPIIAQRAVEVKEGDTPERLQKRVMREAEWVILPQAVETVCERLEGERK